MFKQTDVLYFLLMTLTFTMKKKKKKKPLIIKVQKLYNWLTSKTLSFNIKKSNFVIFHPQLKQLSYQTKRCIFDNKYFNLQSNAYIKYPGVLIAYRAGLDFLLQKLVWTLMALGRHLGARKNRNNPLSVSSSKTTTEQLSYLNTPAFQTSVFNRLTKLPVCW